MDRLQPRRHALPSRAPDLVRNSIDLAGNSSTRSTLTSPASTSRTTSIRARVHTPSNLPAPSSGHVSSLLAPAWPFNEQDTKLIKAGYRPAFKPKKPEPTGEKQPAVSDQGSTADSSSKAKPKSRAKATAITTLASSPSTTSVPTAPTTTRLVKMAEPRARVARHKGQMNFASELRLLLLAYGDPAPHPSFPTEPLPETVRVLDEIVTDFILEMCHEAAQYANYARRQKIKVDDFRFALRRDPNKLGRVQELLRMERELKEARKAFDQNDDQVAKDAGKKGGTVEDVEDDGDGGAGAGAGKKSKGKSKGKRAARRDSDATEDKDPKKRKITA